MIMGRSAYLLDGRRVTLTDLLDAGLLNPGDQLEFKRPRIGEIYHACVTKSGALALEGDQEFRSPSRAAMVAADVTAIDGWHAWALPDGRSLDSLRQQLLDQAATEAPAEVTSARWDPQKRYEWLKNARVLADAGTPAVMLVRDLVARWEEGAGYERIEADLANHGLGTPPNFRKVSLETPVRLMTPIPAREARYDQELIEVLPDLETWDFVNAGTTRRPWPASSRSRTWSAPTGSCPPRSS
jgi:hypothetical protein